MSNLSSIAFDLRVASGMTTFHSQIASVQLRRINIAGVRNITPFYTTPTYRDTNVLHPVHFLERPIALKDLKVERPTLSIPKSDTVCSLSTVFTFESNIFKRETSDDVVIVLPYPVDSQDDGKYIDVDHAREKLFEHNIISLYDNKWLPFAVINKHIRNPLNLSEYFNKIV